MTFAANSTLVADLHPSPNIDERRRELQPTMLILHYTGLPTIERSIEVLADPRGKVSCHYVVALDGRITQMVAEQKRGWHAGVSIWRGESDINSASIGIEIQNAGHDAGNPAFPAVQMLAVRDLCLDICSRHAILPEGILAHSDVAPARKKDPGERFDWPWLANAGVGHWVAPEMIGGPGRVLAVGDQGEAVRDMQRLLAAYGYGIEQSGMFDAASELVVIALQRHFRPARVDGRYDASTAATLERLIAALPAAKPIV